MYCIKKQSEEKMVAHLPAPSLLSAARMERISRPERDPGGTGKPTCRKYCLLRNIIILFAFVEFCFG